MNSICLELNMALVGSQRTTRTEDEDDAQLMMRVQRRSKSALESLYDRYAPKANGLAYKLLQDRELAEEVVQEAFWRIWQRADQFQSGRGSFAQWLYGIVRHLALDELRRAHLYELSDGMAETNQYGAHEQVAEAAIQHIDAEKVRSALRCLPSAQRQVIELSYFHGLTRQQIAQRLDEPLGTIHTRAALGLSKLREMMCVT